jgi:hypothetical protein
VAGQIFVVNFVSKPQHMGEDANMVLTDAKLRAFQGKSKSCKVGEGPCPFVPMPMNGAMRAFAN